jgi:hypothetical protein
MQKVIDEIIRAAMERGEFDNLSGRGKPQDHTAYFNTPEDLRLAHSVLKNSGYVPEEVHLLREVEELKRRRAASTDAGERKRLDAAIRDTQLRLDLMLESNRRARGKRR